MIGRLSSYGDWPHASILPGVCKRTLPEVCRSTLSYTAGKFLGRQKQQFDHSAPLPFRHFLKSTLASLHQAPLKYRGRQFPRIAYDVTCSMTFASCIWKDHHFQYRVIFSPEPFGLIGTLFLAPVVQSSKWCSNVNRQAVSQTVCSAFLGALGGETKALVDTQQNTAIS